MNKIIKYKTENDLESMVQAILKNNKDIDSVIQQVRQSRVEYQSKSQLLQWALEAVKSDIS
jgi:hypothetical protein